MHTAVNGAKIRYTKKNKDLLVLVIRQNTIKRYENDAAHGKSKAL